MRYLTPALLSANLVLAGVGLLLLGRSPDERAEQLQVPEGMETVRLVAELYPAEPAEPGCFGPFAQPEAAREMRARLLAAGLAAEISAVDAATGGRDYRVLLPPADSSSAAFQLLRELRARQLDSFVIEEGRHALGISLGVFSTLPAAEALREEIRRQDYPAEIVSTQRRQKRYWLVPAADSDPLPPVAIPGLPPVLPCPAVD